MSTAETKIWKWRLEKSGGLLGSFTESIPSLYSQDITPALLADLRQIKTDDNDEMAQVIRGNQTRKKVLKVEEIEVSIRMKRCN